MDMPTGKGKEKGYACWGPVDKYKEEIEEAMGHGPYLNNECIEDSVAVLLERQNEPSVSR